MGDIVKTTSLAEANIGKDKQFPDCSRDTFVVGRNSNVVADDFQSGLS